MSKLSLSSLDKTQLEGKKVLVRVDFNVPLHEDAQITDDTRIRAAIPTIEYLINHSAKVILAAHFGRPKGQVNEKMRLTPVAARLSELLGQNVALTNSCIGDEAVAQSIAYLMEMFFYLKMFVLLVKRKRTNLSLRKN